MDLDNLIKEYKKISLEIKNSLDNDNFDSLDELLNQREEIINNCNKEELQKLQELYSKYEIFQLDKLMLEEIELKKNQLRKKMSEVEKGKKVTKGYNDLNTRAVFLSKEI